MTRRIVLFGATGFTGRLTAHALVRRDLPASAASTALLLVGRDQGRLAGVAAELSGSSGARSPMVDTAVAAAGDGDALRRLLSPGDVLVTTVGPFGKLGAPAVGAAIDAGATYLDSTGEPAFLRRVFEKFGPQARARGVALLPAFGYDYVPGNLAGALALRGAGAAATRVDIGYFVDGDVVASGGTAASGVGVVLEPGFAWRSGRLVTERLGTRLREFSLGGRDRPAISVGGTEHLALPRLAAQLGEINVYIGWAGRWSRSAQLMAGALVGAARIPGVRRPLTTVLDRAAARRAGQPPGPDAAQRKTSRSLVVAEAFGRSAGTWNGGGDQVLLDRVVLAGPNAYDLTAELLAWGATSALDRSAARVPLPAGACGPVEAFGLETLERACAAMDLRALR